MVIKITSNGVMATTQWTDTYSVDDYGVYYLLCKYYVGYDGKWI